MTGIHIMKRKGWRVSPEFQSMMCFLVTSFACLCFSLAEICEVVIHSSGVIWKSADGSKGTFRNDEQKAVALTGEPCFARIFLNFWWQKTFQPPSWHRSSRFFLKKNGNQKNERCQQKSRIDTLKPRSGYDSTNLVSIIKYHKPDILIGAVGKAPGCFTEDGDWRVPWMMKLSMLGFVNV